MGPLLNHALVLLPSKGKRLDVPLVQQAPQEGRAGCKACKSAGVVINLVSLADMCGLSLLCVFALFGKPHVQQTMQGGCVARRGAGMLAGRCELFSSLFC